ncbi:MAG: DUF1456 family protein [Gammaproteobacteria bacterium]|nr:DUF1456 family protein [Gammaproteobacteria bacterium]
MTNNDCLRRIRGILDPDELALIRIYSHAGQEVTQEEINNLLKQEDADDFTECTDSLFTAFLNGLIIEKRGAKEGAKPPAEERLTNNIIFKKLRIAFDLKAEDILSVLSLADSDCKISKHELSAFFRKPESGHFRACKDPILENFLDGLQIKHGAEQ